MPETCSQLIYARTEAMKNSEGQSSAVNGFHFQVSTLLHYVLHLPGNISLVWTVFSSSSLFLYVKVIINFI